MIYNDRPNWKDAPEWANYLAMDADGSWFWYEEEPKLDKSMSIWNASKGTRYSIAGQAINYATSLEKRE